MAASISIREKPDGLERSSRSSSEFAAEDFVNEQEVQRNHHSSRNISHGVGETAIHQITHHGFAPSQIDQGDQGKGEREAEDRLWQHQNIYGGGRAPPGERRQTQ